MGLGAGNAAIKKSDKNPPFGSCTLVQKMNFEQNGQVDSIQMPSSLSGNRQSEPHTHTHTHGLLLHSKTNLKHIYGVNRL